MPANRHAPRAAAALFAALALPLGAASTAHAQDAAPGAEIDKAGWWNRTRGPQEGEPDNPVRPALAPVPAAPTNVPANAIGVGATGGDPTKVAAVGILLDAPAGASVDLLKLTLKEAPDQGANVAGDQAKIVACPITGFWGDARNANWIDRPQADCDRATAAGTRAPDGTWTFDLTSMASMWTDPAGPGQNGVLLVESVDAPSGFEVSFLAPETGTARLEFAASGGGDGSDAATFPAATDSATSGGDGGTGFGADTSSFDLGRVGSPADVPELSPAPLATGAPTAPVTRRPAPPVTRPVTATGTRAGKLTGNLSPATLALVPAGLGLALVLSLYLGAAADATNSPGASPASTRRRAGGVTRALARRRSEQRARTARTNP